MQVNIEKIVFGGDGLAKIDGRPLFVPLSVDGETVEIEIVRQHKDFDEAVIKEIKVASKHRVKSKCPLFGKCGGCQWQHIDYNHQLKLKKKIVEENWRRIAKVDVNVEDVLPSPKKWHYRNRIQLHVDKYGNVGFKERGSHRVVNVDICYIADERLNEMLKKKRDEIKFFNKGLSLNVDDERNTEGSFAQVNSLQNENLKKIVCEYISSCNAKTVLELYAGSGNLTFAIAPCVNKIHAGDIDKRAVNNGNRVAEEKGFGNVEFIFGASKNWLEKIEDNYDLILLDPPRVGAKDSIAGILKIRPKNIVYVSCDPATLARDSKMLIDGGYNILKCQPIDMFPQTFHVENVVLFGL